MLVKTVTVPARIPKNGFLNEIKFWLWKMELESIAEGYDITLDEQFWKELTKFNGESPVITFCQKEGYRSSYRLEEFDEYFARETKKTQKILSWHDSTEFLALTSIEQIKKAKGL